MTELTISLVILGAFAALSSALPYLTRPELFFAVTVNEQFRHTQSAHRIVWQYQVFGWFVTGGLALLTCMGWTTPAIAVNSSIAAWVLAGLIARRRVLPHHASGTTVREAGLRVRRERFPGGITAMIGPFVILAAKAAYIHGRWDQIPERVPVHWGLNGPDRWMIRTPFAVYGSVVSVALICAVMIVIAYATIHASRKVSTTDQSQQRFRKISILGLVALAYVFAVVLPPISGGTPDIPLAPFLILGVAIVFVGLTVWSGQGGTRLRGYHPLLNDSSPTGDRTPDKCWKLGMIYYNPDDPALMIEKRFGIGWTMNFGNRWSWIIMGSTLLVPVLMRLVAS